MQSYHQPEGFGNWYRTSGWLKVISKASKHELGSMTCTLLQ
uniref:Uncharacterized protein n=1 Tax=Arundo donax TaxID=35708 RepID=A0A0A9H714_ARUDO